MPTSIPVVTGYYRYTDIWFEWHQALPDIDDRAPVKAILSHDALVHPEHPLHVEGINGIQMYIGTFATGEARLLFSSRQVDYLRYWLHAMQLTKGIVPLPYSDCLLTESNLETVSPVVYPDGLSLRNALKVIDKNNKRLKGSNPLLTHRRHLFERVRNFWSEKKGVWCAMDFEAWELDHTVLTEFGWSLAGWKDGSLVEDRGHLIVEEARSYINSQYVPDHRYDYTFGTSETVKKALFKKRIQYLVKSLNEYGPVFLVFHDNSQDIKDLKKLEVDLEGMSYIMPDSIPDSGIFVIDTSDLIGALLGEGSGEKRSLDKTCSLLQIPTQYLHNAGNDAHYTLLSMQEMAKGDPIDIQREKRWPNQTPAGVKVELKPWQEDSDYSDEEGVIPPPEGYKFVTDEDEANSVHDR
ncbi:Good for full DBP5 activity protein 2 [Psilocybe cubensis]|uniref:Good for full DBP5 activity protein 2 n=2 Tax=Psilocybe cubensis TaxID=181762 RepID=A0ACB8H499_PSICU|nr:Good for full DBP5 activity protein 2 [Psilocybe cubensis]KAH9482738.1 Good for full DBP5 activity protein 2 [Psilocybe cubensis]